MFKQTIVVELSGQEVATIVLGLGELPAKLSHELLTKFVAIDAIASAEAAKVPGPELHLVSKGPAA